MDKEAFISLLHHAKIHAEAGSKIENPDLFESVVMSILVEHQKELQQLQGCLLQPQTKTVPGAGEPARLRSSSKVTLLAMVLQFFAKTVEKHYFTCHQIILKRYKV